MQHGEPVEALPRDAHVARHREGGRAGPFDGVPNERDDRAGQNRVEAGGRVVEHEEAGLGGDRAAQRDALLHAPGKLGRRTIGNVRPEAHRCEDFHGPLLGGAAGHPVAVDKGECHVLPHAETVEERVLLEQHADAAHQMLQFALVEACEVGVSEADAAALHRHQAEQAFQQDRLAARRRADQHGRLPLGHVEIDSAQHGPAVERLDHAACRDRNAHGPSLARISHQCHVLRPTKEVSPHV